MTDSDCSAIEEVRTRRLVIVDDNGSPCVVGEVVDGAAELRIGLGQSSPSDPHVLIYAAPGNDDSLGPQLGVQLWANGNAYAEVDLLRENDRWTAELHLTSEHSLQSDSHEGAS